MLCLDTAWCFFPICRKADVAGSVLAVGSRFCFWQEAVRSEVHRTVHAGEVGPASVVKEVRVSSFAQHLFSCIQQEHNNHSKCASHENITIHHLLFVVQMENCVTLLSLFLTRHSVRKFGLWSTFPSQVLKGRYFRKHHNRSAHFSKCNATRKHRNLKLCANSFHNVRSLCRLWMFWKQNALDMDTTRLKIKLCINDCSNKTCILR